MTKSSLPWLLGVFLTSTIGFAGCRDDANAPASGTGGAPGTGGRGGTGGAKAGSGGSPAGGATGGSLGAGGGTGGSAAGGTDGGGLGGDANGSDANAGGTGGTLDAAIDVPVTPIDMAPDVVTGTPDTSSAVVNGCTDFEDESVPGADAYINWKNPLAAAEKCIQIKVGQQVTFGTTDFSVHPLVPSGGDAGNPIQPQSDGDDDYKVTFPAAGVFGFKCTVHAAMNGAIKVVP
jgi:plastocyanin